MYTLKTITMAIKEAMDICTRTGADATEVVIDGKVVDVYIRGLDDHVHYPEMLLDAIVNNMTILVAA